MQSMWRYRILDAYHGDDDDVDVEDETFVFVLFKFIFFMKKMTFQEELIKEGDSS